MPESGSKSGHGHDPRPELVRQLSAIGQRVEVPWSAQREGRIRLGLERRRHAQRVQRVLLTAGAGIGAAAALVLLAIGVPRLHGTGRPGSALPPAAVARLTQPAAPTPAAPPALEPTPVATPARKLRIQLRDGSLARAFDGDGEERCHMNVRDERPERTVIELSRGRALFEVAKNPRRLFRVESGGLAVEALGTKFSVERLGDSAAAATRVTVQEGRVRVLWAAHYAELGVGQSGEFPPQPGDQPVPAPVPVPALAPAPAAAPPARKSVAAAAVREPAEPAQPHIAEPRPSEAADAATEPPAPPSPAAEPAPAGPAAAAPSWQQLAHEGQFERAYERSFGAATRSSDSKLSPVELLLLADVARLSRHPADAVAPLERLLRTHLTDPRAPLAAFTLGRVLLDDLGRPREAADAFARAQTLDVQGADGPMAQDALAREVEAWSRAGEPQRARERALEYVRRYPTGRRLRSVRHYGELD